MRAFSFLILITLSGSLKTEKFSGIIFDPTRLEENSIDFTEGFESWDHQGVKIINLASEANVDNIPSNGSVLVPEPDASGASKHILERNFTIGARSKLEMWFSIYVVGYNASIVPKENVPDLNPSFSISILDLSSGNETEILDLARLNVTNQEWNYRQFYITVKEEAEITIKFSMERKADTNTIALGDAQIQWVPVLKTEMNHEHSDVLFGDDSDDYDDSTTGSGDDDDNITTEATSSTIPMVESSTTSTPTTTPHLIENSTNVANSTSSDSSTITPSTSTNSTTSNTSTTTTTTTTPTTTTTSDSTDTTTTLSTAAAETTVSSSTNLTTPEVDTENTTSLETTTTGLEGNQTTTLKLETTTTMSEVSTADSQTNSTDTNSTSVSTKTPTPSNSSTTKEMTESTTSISTGSQSPIIDSEFSGYGYPVEVALICLVVLFGVMFLVMVVKYYRLRTTIGDYRLRDNNGGRQTYDNPAFNGFGLQDTYRSR